MSERMRSFILLLVDDLRQGVDNENPDDHETCCKLLEFVVDQVWIDSK